VLRFIGRSIAGQDIPRICGLGLYELAHQHASKMARADEAYGRSFLCLIQGGSPLIFIEISK
jgi:hypothetical protein